MTLTQKATNKLFQWSPWLLTFVTVYLVPFSLWVGTSILRLQGDEATEDHMTRKEAVTMGSDITEHFNEHFNNLPPEEWKERIMQLEESRMSESIALAKIQTSLEDIKSRVIALDMLHREKMKEASTP